jgi:membrane-associated protease RseP (regulator of RpoE activity)
MSEATQEPVKPAAAHEPLTAAHLKRPRQRRVLLPIVLFVVTCLSTFYAGALNWTQFPIQLPNMRIGDSLRFAILTHWEQGVAYMVAVLAILFAHEMGHFIATLLYRIPASLPFFIPFPFSPIGTMGAVIGMAGYRANRRQIFDIGIAGPIAGLVVAIPILIMGLKQFDPLAPKFGQLSFDCPLIVRMLMSYLHPQSPAITEIWVSQLNPMLMAAWVGLLITGLNMLPLSQLDGGHVIYCLLLKKGHWVARGFLMFAIAYVVLSNAIIWVLMIILVTIMGVDHPPTANDRVPLGLFRTVLGYASLAIPVLCFPARGLIQDF